MGDNIFFSPSTRGFYRPEIHGDTIPDDAAEISIDEWRRLIAGQNAGQVIKIDKHGRPYLADPPAYQPTTTDVKSEANRRIAAVMPDWMVARAVSGGAPIDPKITAYAQAVREASGRLEALDPIPPDFAENKHWPTYPAA